jgi:glyoxylase-like metal-dependent hydrolase (beta-lactamase superfamily II)
MTSGRPFPIVADVTQMIVGWGRLKKLASRPQYIVPGHDPGVMQRLLRAGAERLRGVAVRLDAEPQGELDGTPQG